VKKMLLLAAVVILATSPRAGADTVDSALSAADDKLFEAQGQSDPTDSLEEASKILLGLTVSDESAGKCIGRAQRLAKQAEAIADGSIRLTVILDARAQVIFARALLEGLTQP